MLVISKKKKDNRKGMGSSHVSGSKDRKERRPSVIMAWGHGPRFRTINRERGGM